MQKLFMLLLLLLIGSFSLHAQQDQRLAATKTPINEVERLQLPSQDNKELFKAEMARRAPGVAPRFAEVMSVDVSPDTHGNWETNNGIATWRLRVPSPGAKSLNFGFDQFFMPPGGSLIIYTPDFKTIQGPFSPADNEVHEELWTPIISNDDLIIEVSLPVSQKEALRLHLKTVNHDFLGFAKSVASQSCNVDVACGLADGFGIIDQYRDIIQSVAVYSTGGNTFCTGFLIANTANDCTPFFITANHCDVGPAQAASLVTYWNFNNSICRQPGSAASGGNGDGSLADFNTGSIYRAGYAPTDFTLLELDDPVSETADAWFAGWDATDNLEQDTLICVHHPDTDEKRISFQFEGVYRGDWNSNDTPVPDGDHIVIEDWNIGTTEGGSSGSPLFDSEKRVVGQLHGGFASCFNDEYDIYGWMHSSWTGGGTPATRLSDWLDPENTGIVIMDGYEQAQCSYFAGATPADQILCAPEVANYDIAVNTAFSGPVSLSIIGIPVALTANFAQSTVMPGETTTLTISGSENLTSGVYTFELQGTDGTNSSMQVLTLDITSGPPSPPTLSSPINMATNQPIVTDLTWEAIDMVFSYDVEIATDPSFTTIIASEMGTTSQNFNLLTLAEMTTYYWRVRASNFCGDGAWSETYSFETGTVSCSLHEAGGFPIAVGPNNGQTAISTLDVNITGTISSLRLLNLDVDHTWTGDLDATLTSPDGTIIQLFREPNCNRPNLLVSFDDTSPLTALDFESTCNQGGLAISGTFQPAQSFSAFAGEEASGPWTLAITDNANNDGGQINGWQLDICTLIPADASVSSSIQNASVCSGSEVPFNVTLGTGFEGDVSLSATGLPAGAILTFDSNPVTGGSVVNATISNIIETGMYDVNIIADDGTNMSSTPISLAVSTAPNFATLQMPADQTETLDDIIAFAWTPVEGATAYTLEVATEDVFSNILLDIDLDETSTTLELEQLGLSYGQYYWRVRAANECGESVSGFSTFEYLDPLNGIQELGNVVLDIHPNPTHGPLRLNLSGDLGTNELTVDAFTSNGQKVASWKLPAITGTQELDLSNLPSGVYWLNITNGKLHATEKVVLIR